MDENTPDRGWLRWAFAAAAALLTVAMLGLIIGSLVPKRSPGPVIGGVGMEDLRTACKLVGQDDRDLCQRVFRVDAAIDDGRCSAAEVMARPITTLSEGESPLRDKIIAYTDARLAPCRAKRDASEEAAGASAGGG